MCGIKPYSSTTPSFPTYPASRQKFWVLPLLSFGPKTRSFSNSSRETLPCRLAPLMTIDKGMPLSLTSKIPFVPFLSPICKIWANSFLSKGRFDIRFVRRFPDPGDSFHFVALYQSAQPQIAKDTYRGPLLKFAANRCRAQSFKFLPWQGIPNDTGAQHVNECGAVVPIRIFGFFSSTWLALITFLVGAGKFWDQGLDQRPKLIGNSPYFNACRVFIPSRIFLGMITGIYG